MKDHFFKLFTYRKQKKESALKALGKQIVMSSTLFSALIFNTVEDSSTFDEAKKLSNYEVVYLTHANFKYYLNVPQEIEEEKGIYERGEVKFQAKSSAGEVDLIGFWIIEIEK